MDEFRKMNIIGFDSQASRRDVLRVIIAITGVELNDGQVILLRISEAAFNPNSAHSLLSEFQLQEKGCKIDSKAKRHGGKQAFWPTGEEDVKIPLTVKGTLLLFKHRYPTTEEMANITPIDITEGMVPWTPHKFEDDPYQINYDLNDPVIITDYKQSPVSRKRGRPRKREKVTAQVNHTSYQKPDDIFYDSEEPTDDQYYSYYDKDTKQVKVLRYYYPSDKIPDKIMYGRAIPLKFHCSIFLRTNDMNSFLANLDDHDLFGSQLPFDSYKYLKEQNYNAVINKAELLDTLQIQDQAYPSDLLSEPKGNTQNIPSLVQDIPSMASLHKHKREDTDLDLLQEKLAFFPKDVVMETLKRTTQLARCIQIVPMRKHIKSMFQIMRKRRVNETHSTDTYFSSVKSVEGYNMAHVFYGCSSGTIHVYGMKSKGKFYKLYQDHIEEVGIPHTLRQDYSKEQGSN